ncbi:adenine phosphoribosyltransferase [Dichotomocladium elegans]|nr:adenine phosphoribosyltransferase [Dichotomocladium elegans]
MTSLLDGARDKQPFRDLDSVYDLMIEYTDFPKPGMAFVDIFPILRNPTATEAVIQRFCDHLESLNVDAIVGLDARGFLLGPPVALRLGVQFLPIRKKGKTPGECFQVTYEKEYGPDTMEIQKGLIKPGARVVIMDDVLATGGTAAAAEKLVKLSGGIIVQNAFLLEGKILQGANLLEAPVFSLFQI